MKRSFHHNSAAYCDKCMGIGYYWTGDAWGNKSALRIQCDACNGTGYDVQDDIEDAYGPLGADIEDDQRG